MMKIIKFIIIEYQEGAIGGGNPTYLQSAETMLVESSPSPGALVCPVCCQTLPNCTTQQDMVLYFFNPIVYVFDIQFLF